MRIGRKYVSKKLLVCDFECINKSFYQSTNIKLVSVVCWTPQTLHTLRIFAKHFFVSNQTFDDAFLFSSNVYSIFAKNMSCKHYSEQQSGLFCSASWLEYIITPIWSKFTATYTSITIIFREFHNHTKMSDCSHVFIIWIFGFLFFCFFLLYNFNRYHSFSFTISPFYSIGVGTFHSNFKSNTH